MEFKVGDIVRIRQDLKEGEIYGDLFALSCMVEESKKDKIWRITGIDEALNVCFLREQEGSEKDSDFLWSSQMLEPSNTWEMNISESDLIDFLDTRG